MKETQLTQMAGEFLTAGKLFKLGYQTAVTLGNAKALDLIVYNPEINTNFSVQVKTLREKNCFDIKREDVKPDHIYVFVFLHDFNMKEEYFILSGATILADLHHFFGTSYTRDLPPVRPGINYGPLKIFKNNWAVFKHKVEVRRNE